MSESTYTVYVISHTHWDREWYAPFQHFRIRLVRLMDRLLDLLERDPDYAHFSLDGQTVLLEDYLEIRPEKRPLLKRLVSEGRLGVGPWFVLPDEFLVSGEALIRNLQLGHRIAAGFGHVQKVGYIPDTFGHISQLPQILRGFGIRTAMHFRGLDETGLNSELWWESPDGGRVLLRHLPTYAGYTNAAVLSSDLNQAIGDLESLAREEARRATTSVLLAMNGVDHMEAREDVPELVREATKRLKHLTFVQASLEEYFAALEAAVNSEALQVVRGELRDTNRTPNRLVMRVLPNILSSRIYNKLQNERAQTWLERWAEPWSALMWTQGEEYPAALLWKAWEWLLKNHPHDSIGGCSVDAVHAQMETRFAWATEIAEMVAAQRFHLLARQIDLSTLEADQAAVVLFNGLAWDWEGVVTVDIDLPVKWLERWAMGRVPQVPAEITADMDYPDVYRWRPALEWGGPPVFMPDLHFNGLTLHALTDGAESPLQIESRSRTCNADPLGGGLNFSQVERVRASFYARVPAFGYAAYSVRPDPKPKKHDLLASPHNVLENDYLWVSIASNGLLTITDKVTGERYRDLGLFEDGGDCGDGYTYSYPAEDRVVNSLGLAPNISRLAAGPAVQRYQLDFDWPLPDGLDDARRRRLVTETRCPLRVVVSLAQKGRRVDLEITFDNRVRDHRLRIVFPSDVSADLSHSEAQFDVVARPVRPQPVPADAWIEDPPSSLPQGSWVDVSDGERGLCIINQGIPEFEVLDTPRREIAITLLRAVSPTVWRSTRTAAPGKKPSCGDRPTCTMCRPSPSPSPAPIPATGRPVPPC
jgi:alpha-mannosidase